MIEFLQLFILGMATGGYYALNALGIVVVFRSSGIINFAAAGLAMVGGYGEWQLADQWGWPRPLAIVGAAAAAGVVSVAVYLLAVRPLGRAATLTKVIATLAVFVSLQQVVVLMFGGIPKVPHPFLPAGTAHLGSLAIGEDSLSILAAATLLTFVLWEIYRHTRFGVATSALAESPRSLSALGWNVSRVRVENWALGGVLAGLAGAGLGPILQLTPNAFTELLIPALAGAMIGGLKSFPMTLVGGLIVGASQAEAGRYLHWSGAGQAVPFLIIIAVLVVRGQTLPLRNFVQERLPRVGSGEIRLRSLGLTVLVVSVLAVVVKDDWVIGATVTMMSATILLSQVVITGYAGQLSLAQLTLGGVAALVAANVSASYGVPFLVSLVVGMLFIIPVSVLVGLPSLRARGLSLAVATLGLAVALNASVLGNDDLTGGLAGLRVDTQSLFGWSIDATDHPKRYFFVVLTVFTALALAVCNVRRGRSGRRLLAVRNNERAARALGIDVTGMKLYAFVLAGVIAAAGGVLLVFDETIPSFLGFDPLVGLTGLIGAVLGGIGFIPGAIIGGLFSQDGLPNAILNPVVGNLTWWTEAFPLFTGIAVVLQLVVNPDGVAAGAPPRSQRRPTSPDSPGTRRLVRAAAAPLLSSAARFGLTAAARRDAAAARRLTTYSAELERADSGDRVRRGVALRASGLRVVFGSVVALDDVSLEVRPGEVLAVIGPNGAGKTTLMDAITGFVAASGTIELDGVHLGGAPAFRRARAGLGRSFQSLELFEDMNVMDNLRSAADPQDRMSMLIDLVHPGRETVTPAMADAIDAFGLRDKLSRLPGEIGYGDRRLVAIARALAGQPSVLLLDEPAAGLSEFERGEVARMITTLARDWNIAIIVIEHDVELVRLVSDRVMVLDFGRCLMTGTPAQVLSDRRVVSAYLGEEPEPVAASAGRPSRRAPAMS